MLFSVIVPSYNIESFISKAITSILNQSFTDFELIVVDDGSTDGTTSIISKYIEEPNVVVINKNNEGLGYARNDGIKIAKGDYLVFVDGDDWVEKDYLFHAASIIKDYDYPDIIRFGWYLDNYDSSDKKRDAYNEDINFIRNQVLSDEYGSQAWKNIYKKTIFKGIEYPNTLYEDLPVTYKLFFAANTIYLSTNCYYHYVIRNSGISLSKNPKKAHDIFVGFKDKYEFAYSCCQSALPELFPKFINASLELIHSYANVKSKEDIKNVTRYILDEISKNKKRKIKSRYKFELFFSCFFTNLYIFLYKVTKRIKK